MDVDYLKDRRTTRDRELAVAERQLLEVQTRHAQLRGAIGEIDAQLNQGKLAADCVAHMFEDPARFAADAIAQMFGPYAAPRAAA